MSEKEAKKKQTELNEFLKDDEKGVMTEKEIRKIESILIEQVSSTNPQKEDFYYHRYTQKRQGHDKKINIPMKMLSLKKERNLNKKRESVVFEGSLGVVIKNTSKAPREVLKEIPNKENDVVDVLLRIEQEYLRLYQLEDLIEENRRRHSSKNKVDEIKEVFFFDLITNTKELKKIFSIPKGHRFIRRVLKVFKEKKYKAQLLSSSLSSFVFTIKSSQESTDSFIENILKPLSSFISEMDLSHLIGFLQKIKSGDSRSAFISKAGQILFCLLLSRANLIDQSNEIERVVEEIYSKVKESLHEMFTVCSCKAETKCFYAWQSLALFTGYLDANNQKDMIQRLHPLVSKTIQEADQHALKNIDVFLDVFGFDHTALI